MKNLQQNSDQKLNILIVSSEMYPYAKIGGLADVVASLSGTLKKMGHDVRVVIPRYDMINKESLNAQKVVEPMGVWMGNKEEWCTVYQITSNSLVPVYLINISYISNDGDSTIIPPCMTMMITPSVPSFPERHYNFVKTSV